jgi:hypothetical protein
MSPFAPRKHVQGDQCRLSLRERTYKGINVAFRSEAVKKLGQAPSRPLIFRGFRRFGSEPVPFFHSLSAKARTFAERKTTLPK